MRSSFKGNDIPQLRTILCLIKLELQMVKVALPYENKADSFSHANWMSCRMSKHLKGSSSFGIVALYLLPGCLLWSAIKNSN